MDRQLVEVANDVGVCDVLPSAPDLSSPPPLKALSALNVVADLLASRGMPELAALEIAKAITSHFGSIAELLSATVEDIELRTGVARDIAVFIAAAGRLHHGILRDEFEVRPSISSFDVLSRYALNRLRGCEIEQVAVMLLDCENRLTHECVLRNGTVDHVQIYPREVVRLALLNNAGAVILVHNHPSGDPTPSQPDIEMSQMTETALSHVGIAFHEHIVVGANRVVGLKEMCLKCKRDSVHPACVATTNCPVWNTSWAPGDQLAA